MNMKTLMEQWQQLRSDMQALNCVFVPTELVPIQLKQTQRQLDRAALDSVLVQLESTSGWLMLPGEVVRLPATIDRAQPPLQAEAVLADVTWQLRHIGENLWQLDCLEAVTCSPEDASHLASVVTHRSTLPDAPSLCYLRLWHIDVEDGPSVSQAMFTGFREAHA